MIISDLEKKLLSLCFHDHDVVLSVVNNLLNEDFSDSNNAKIYTAIAEMEKNKIQINYESIVNYFEANKPEQFNNFQQYISDLSLLPIYDHKYDQDLKMLKAFSNKRKLIKLFDEFNKKPFNYVSFEKEINDLYNDFVKIKTANNKNDGMVLSDLIKEVDKNVEMAKMLSTTDQRLISTGINKIDEIFGNFGIGELHVLAGRPGCGKTAFSIKLAYQTALNLAKDNNRYAQQIGYRKKIVLFFSCEMESNKIAERFIALHMGNAFRVSAALPAFFSSHPDFLKKYMHARDFFLNGDIPIYISDNCYSIEEIEDRIRWYSNHFEISLIVIDYVQRINVTNNKSKNQFEIVAHVVKTLKNISKIQRNVVFALAQASRAVDAKENRGTKTTSSVELSDVRDSSAIECEADSVSFILPGDNNASDDEEHTNSNDDEFTMVSYWILKNRHGQSRYKIGLAYKKKTNDFSCFEN